MIGFEDACLDSHVGSALLASLEARQRDDVGLFAAPSDTTPAAVNAAVSAVESMQFGKLCAAAVDASESLVGPWTKNAAETALTVARWAEPRRPIAAAIAGRFDAELHAPMNPDSQQWWSSASQVDEPSGRPPLFERYGDVYGNGEFTLAGLWTTTNPPSQVHDGLIDAWEIWPGPISRWHLPTRPRVRVFEVHRPQDWAELVSTCAPRQRMMTGLGTHVLPDWSRVAESFDAVHLSWAGFITTEGSATPVGDEAITMLRHWSSERTLWLNDCFAEPQPLDAPILSGRVNGDVGISAWDDLERRAADVVQLELLLGRKLVHTDR